MQSQIISEQGVKRIFEGELVPQRKRSGEVHCYIARGFHLEDPAMMAVNGYIINEVSRTSPDSRGVYHVSVWMYGRRRNSAFFPRHWTREQVAQAIAQAYESREPFKWGEFVNCYKGSTETGMRIVMELDEMGLVLDAFPKRAKVSQKKNALWRIENGLQVKSRFVCSQCKQIKILSCPHGHNLPMRKWSFAKWLRRWRLNLC
jgi:hypothetical protein